MNPLTQLAAVALLAGLAVATPASAGGVVHFVDGRALRVSAIDTVEGMTCLRLPGGGELSVPPQRIERFVSDPPAPPAPPAPAIDHEASAWWAAAGPYAHLIAQASERYSVDPALLTAMAQVESALDPRAISPKGAAGLLQLMPDTARRFGVNDVFDVAQNVDGGARYLKWLLERFEGRTELALAGYNAGEGAVDRYRGVPPFDETRAYVSQVLAGADRLASR